MRIVELGGWDRCETLMPAWSQLWSDQPGAPVFLHPIWARSWWDAFGGGRRLRLLLVEQAGRPVGLAPLFLERPLPLPGRLRTIGAGVTNDYSDWLLPGDPQERAACVDAIFTHLAQRQTWLTLELQGLRPDSRLLPLLARAGHSGMLVRTRAGLPCPAVTIDGSWGAFLGGRSANLRWKVRNRRRRLEQLGEVRFEHADAATAGAAIDELIRLHRLRWTGRPDVTLVSRSTRGRAFYRTVLTRLVKEGIADVVCLRLDGRVVAAQAGFIIGSTYAYYQVAFDPSMSRYEPGTLLVAYLLERAWSRGLRTFDFMSGDEPYKYRWSDADPVLTHATLVPDRAVARGAWLAMEVGRRLRDRRAALRNAPAANSAGAKT